ncbi:hypothetical protein AB0K05_25265 [Nonomuraea sp. NPDC049486]|uniref:hypothetical protein n=1 Tax=Nonomuraea sp. NPDC049486 TaxID=3155773 RepID=UPI00342A4E02
MSGAAHKTTGATHELAEWMTLVARHSRTSLAPSLLPAPLVRRWRDTPVVVATGEEDCFYPPARLREPALALLGTEAVAMPGGGHL